MKHSYDDGRGPREVWLDGFLLDQVIECDTDTRVALVTRQPIQVFAGVVQRDALKGCVMVVREIGNESKKV